MKKLTATMDNDVLSKGILSAAETFDAGTFSGVSVSYLKATRSVVADLGNSTNNAGFATGDVYSGITHLIGSGFDDILIGNASNNSLSGGSGNDTLIGGAGSDTLYGGSGNDTFVGLNTDGTDVIIGGAGIDTVDYSAATNSVVIALNRQNFFPHDRISGVENAIGGSNNDVLFGNAGANLLNGGAGNDYLTSGAGNDTLLGGEGNDDISSGTGNDWVDGGAGDDILDTGAGNDIVLGGDGNDFILLGEGNDSVEGGTGNDRLFGREGADTLVGGIGNDMIVLEETVSVTDVVRIAAGDSTPTAANPTAFDSIGAFDLGNGVDTQGVDQLDLDSTLIAPDTAGLVQGVPVGSFAQFSISHGMVTLYDSAGVVQSVSLINAGQALTFMAATNEYSQVLPDNNTLALVVDNVNPATGALTGTQSTILFQDVANSTADTVVQLQGFAIGSPLVTYSSVIATGISNDGMMDGGIWLV